MILALTCQIRLGFGFDVINKFKLSLQAKVIAIYYNKKNVANRVTQPGLQMNL